MIDQFKNELRALLSRFPQVKGVKIVVEEEITAQPNGSGTPGPIEHQPPISGPVSAAEQTIAALKGGMTGKVKVEQSQ